ncbi:hypothetical protein X748_27730 [Mesorhizobium sp. LNJC386A00]|nr:hypothetical protein X748_27730 [Mesorhizobium sp. LNJC386A00]
MAGNVTSVSFSGRFKKLNGTVALTATRADIIRSLLTVGYPSRRAAVRVVGRWRERMLVAMATGYLDNALNTTLYFRNLEQSEKVGVSFLLGEAFTHWYAQDRMKIEYLVHVGGLSSCSWTSPTTPLAPKTGASPPAAKSRPDFIGIRRAESHVFESKGRIRRPAASAVSKALGQVSALHSVNGKAPKTRCASFFMLRSAGTEGFVSDPPVDGKGSGVNFDVLDALAKAYSFFLDEPTTNLPADVSDGYVGREIEDGVYFGLDKKVFAAIQERPDGEQERRRRTAEIFAIIADRSQSYEGRRERNVSAGPDGTILIDRRSRPGSRQRIIAK